MSSPNFPEEIMVEIFCRLPTKSAGRCRWLSKTWRSRLSTPEFTHLQLTTRKTTHQLILLSEQLSENDAFISKVYTTPFPVGENSTISVQIQLSTTPRYEIAGSCRGLVLLTNNKDESLLLLNPVTMDKVSIPAYSTSSRENSTIQFAAERTMLSYGLGYNNATHDYKIASYGEFRTRYGSVPRYTKRSDPFVDVYSVKTGVWKTVSSSLYHQGFENGAFLNGSIHWLCATSPSSRPVIGAFDLTDEVFTHAIPLPCDDHQLLYNGPFVVCGFLCMASFKNGDTAHDVWMMKEYGSPESWTKITTIHGIPIAKPLCSIGDDKILALTLQWTLVVYKLKEGVSENIVVDGIDQKSIYDGATFVDCLVSPNHHLAGYV